MYCHACGKQIPDGVKFCLYCGAAQEASAPAEPAAAPQPAVEQPYYQPAPAQPSYAAQASYAAPAQMPEQPKERFLAGFFGALLCSLAGVAVQVILAQMGYVAALSGLVMSFCTFMGYAHFARRLSVKGIIASVIIIIVMVMVGRAINTGVTVLRVVPLTGSELFKVAWQNVIHTIPSTLYTLTHPEADFHAEVLESVLQQYGFAALGAVPTIVGLIKGRKK